MSDLRPSSLPERNPVTYRAHRKEVFWQITIPLVIVSIIIIALAFLTVQLGDYGASKLADVALIWLIIPAMAVGVVFLALLGAIAYGIIWLIRYVPGYARKTQAFIISVSLTIKRLTNAVVEPFIRVHSFLAIIRAILRR